MRSAPSVARVIVIRLMNLLAYNSRYVSIPSMRTVLIPGSMVPMQNLLHAPIVGQESAMLDLGGRRSNGVSNTYWHGCVCWIR
jgi:hypothetical protein